MPRRDDVEKRGIVKFRYFARLVGALVRVSQRRTSARAARSSQA
jgi:hypothetical protein